MTIYNIDENTLIEKKAIHTAKEIYQQPNTWIKTINQVRKEKDELLKFINNVVLKDDYDIILAGAGTSEFVGNAIFSALSKKYNHKVKSYATTDIVAAPELYLSKDKPTLLISFGRSGNSPESVGTVDVANIVCNKVYHLVITCNHQGALAKLSNKDNVFALNLTPETHDESFAMTSSFTNMFLATLLSLNLNELDDIEIKLNQVCNKVQNLLDNDYNYLNNIINEFDFQRIVYLGSNVLKGIAQESQLKLLELCAGKIPTMYDSTMGFRHGPKSIINSETLTVIYISDDEYTKKYDIDLLKEMSGERNGNKILALTNTYQKEVSELCDYYYSFNNESLNNEFLGLEYIVVAQLIALFKALYVNNTPDSPCSTGTVNRVVCGVNLYPYKVRS